MFDLNWKAWLGILLGIPVALSVLSRTDSGLLAACMWIVVVMLFDLWIRYYSEDFERPLFDPAAGASFCSCPFWAVGWILIVILCMAEYRVFPFR